MCICMKLWQTICLSLIIGVAITYGLELLLDSVLHCDEYKTIVSNETDSYKIGAIYDKNPEHLDILYYDNQGIGNRLIDDSPNIVNIMDSNTSFYSVTTGRNKDGVIIKREKIYYISAKTPVSPLPPEVAGGIERRKSNPPPGMFHPPPSHL